MDTVLFVRIAVTLTFLILAAGGPYALIMLNRFIMRYKVAHAELKAHVGKLEERIARLEEPSQ